MYDRAAPGRVLAMLTNTVSQGYGQLRMTNPTDAENQHWELISDGIQNSYDHREMVIGRRQFNGVFAITAFGVTPTGNSHEKLDLELVTSLL